MNYCPSSLENIDCPFNIFLCSFLHLGKMLLLLVLGFMYGLHETTPRGVDSICQQIIMWIKHSRFLHFNNFATKGDMSRTLTSLFPPKQAKKHAPYPQRLINNNFKNYVSCVVFVLKLTLPCH